MTEDKNTSEDAAARIAARGEEVTLGAVLKEQSSVAMQRVREARRVVLPEGKRRITINRVKKV
jgi:hypothetical protein